jgi:Glycosyltransferase family 87
MRVPVFVWIVVVTFCGLWIALGSMIAPSAKGHDFLNLYSAGSLALDGKFATLHDPAVQLEREQRFVPSTPKVIPFGRPLFYSLALAPLAAIPFTQAFWVFIVTQSLLLLGCWAWAWRRFGPNALVFAALSLPGPLGIASGQDCTVFLALLIVAYELADRKRPAAAGAVLGLMLVKYHLMLLWPVALVLQKRWKMLAGFCVVALAEVALSLALGGVAGARSYISLLRNSNLEDLDGYKELTISLHGFAANLGIESGWVIGAMTLAIVAIFLVALPGAPLWRMFAMTAVASLLIVPHVHGYDATLLLWPFLLTIFESQIPASKIAATLLCTPLAFGFALAGKPYAIVASASLVIFFLLLAYEKYATVPARSLSSPHSAPA